VAGVVLGGGWLDSLGLGKGRFRKLRDPRAPSGPLPTTTLGGYGCHFVKILLWHGVWTSSSIQLCCHTNLRTPIPVIGVGLAIAVKGPVGGVHTGNCVRFRKRKKGFAGFLFSMALWIRCVGARFPK